MTTRTPSSEKKSAWVTSSEKQHQPQQSGRIVGETRYTTTTNVNKSVPYSYPSSSSTRRSRGDIAALKELILGGLDDGTEDETVATVLSSVPSQGSSTTTTSTSTTTAPNTYPSARMVTGSSGSSSADGNPPPRQGGELPSLLQRSTRSPRHSSVEDIQYLEDLVLQGDEDYEEDDDVTQEEEVYNEETRVVTAVEGSGSRRTGTPSKSVVVPRIAHEDSLNIPEDDEDAPYNLELSSCTIVSSPNPEASATVAASWSFDHHHQQQQQHWNTGNDTVVDASVEVYSPYDHPDGLNPGRGNAGDGIEATTVSHVLGFAFTAEEDELRLATCCRGHPCGKKKWLLAIILTAALAGLIATTFGENDKEGDRGTKTSTRAWESDARYPEMMQVFERVSDPVAFVDPFSPQSQALTWLVYEDQLLQAISDPNLLQRYALLVLAFATGGANWRAIDPWDEQYTGHECTSFQGLDCNDNGEVVNLDLFLRRLTGYLPAEIGLLTALTDLDLARNSLESSIPEQFYQLTNLEYLDLSVNSFSSTISPSIAKLTRMQSLIIAQTRLTGSLPDSMMQMTNILDFVAFGGLFHAPAMDFALSWPKLERYDIGLSNMYGTLTSEIGKLTNLRWLFLFSNNIEGSIVSELGLLTKLEILGIQSDNINGTIPRDIGKLSKLTKLVMLGEQMTGLIPTELGLLTALQVANFGRSRYSGTLPTEIGRLTNMRLLSFYFNKMTGTIPSQLGELSALENLLLALNSFEGSIPAKLCEGYSEISRDCAVECKCCRQPCT